jgi:hypothetical protein
MRWVGRWVGLLGIGVFAFGCFGIACSGDEECADGEIQQRVCVECGEAGGCAKRAEQCAKMCEIDDECRDVSPGFACFEGVCQMTFCV